MHLRANDLLRRGLRIHPTSAAGDLGAQVQALVVVWSDCVYFESRDSPASGNHGLEFFHVDDKHR